MAQPTPYNRLYDFSDYQEVNPTKPLRGSEVDAELDAIKLTTDQIRANAALIQRDDGKLANQSVTPESLEAGTLALISQGEYNPRGAWAGSTAYGLGDVVTFNAATYLCIVAHTSVTQFANDLAANKWLLIANGALAGGGQAVDLFEGTGSQTVFTLSFTYNGNNAAVVFVAGVAQIPGQDFTISGSTLTFVSAPPTPAVAGRKNVMVRGTGIEAQLAADGAATAAANASASATAAANSATAASASQTAAATSATNAANSATAAAGSASTASTQATTATTQAANASNSATAAAASQSAAATSATNAANSATAAAGSATTATTQATTATNQATAAANSATAASNSATAAAGSASTASGAATTATNQATAASTSATAASTSASNAANSASQAATSASNAAASASSASSSASSANTSAVNAATSATNASNSATAAGNSAAAASTSATNAANSATTATTQATNASNSATAAAGSASSAAASAAAAAASLDNFDDRYLGPKTSNPTVDNDGNPLVTGALYYRTTAPIGMKVWDGSQWLEASAAQQASLVTFEYVATAGQTTFSGADANGVTLSYTVGNVFVSVNGVRIRPGDDFTATTGTSVVLLVAATAGDEIIIDAFRTFEVTNTYTQAQVDALLAQRVAKTGDTMTGVLTSPGYRSDGSGALGGGFDGTTGSGNFGVRVRAKSDDSVAILQFTNNVASAQWGVLNSYPSGAIGMPYQPSFRARFASRSSVYGGGTALFDQPTHNTGNNYSTSTGRFTAPVSGVYQFHMNVQHYGGTATGSTHDILVNGAFAQARCEHVTGANFECHSASLIVYLNAGDYVECQSGSSVWWSDFAQFCGALIG